MSVDLMPIMWYIMASKNGTAIMMISQTPALPSETASRLTWILSEFRIKGKYPISTQRGLCLRGSCGIMLA